MSLWTRLGDLFGLRITVTKTYTVHEMTDDEGLICSAANSMSEPLTLVAPGVAYIKAEAAQMLLDRARELGGGD